MRKLVFIALLIAAFAAPVVAQAPTPPPTVAPPQRPTAVVPASGVLSPVFIQQQTPPPPPPPPTVAPGRGGRGQMTPPPTGQPIQPSVPAPGQRGGRGQGGQPGQQPAPMNMNVAVTRGPWQPPAQNVRVELTIGDSASAKAGKKSVSMLLADGHSGRIRSGSKDGVLNVDGTARTGSDGRILLDLTIEYSPDRLAATAVLNESISVVVTSGQSTLVSRSADPASERSVTVEVVATIVK